MWEILPSTMKFLPQTSSKLLLWSFLSSGQRTLRHGSSLTPKLLPTCQNCSLLIRSGQFKGQIWLAHVKILVENKPWIQNIKKNIPHFLNKKQNIINISLKLTLKSLKILFYGFSLCEWHQISSPKNWYELTNFFLKYTIHKLCPKIMEIQWQYLPCLSPPSYML